MVDGRTHIRSEVEVDTLIDDGMDQHDEEAIHVGAGSGDADVILCNPSPLEDREANQVPDHEADHDEADHDEDHDEGDEADHDADHEEIHEGVGADANDRRVVSTSLHLIRS